MKKLITKISAVAVVSAALFSASAFAKTEGSYVGVDIVKSSTSSVHRGSSQDTTASFDDQSNTSLGINAKYAVNFDGIFVAPGIFYERIGSETTDNQFNAEGFSVNNRWGGKVDIGYDLNENVAVYFTNGLAHVRTKQDWSENGDGVGGANTLKEGNTSYFYGVGLLSHVNDRFTIGAEYNTQNVEVRSLGHENELFLGQETRTDIDVFKLTFAYNF